MSENTTPNDLAEHIATVLDGHHGGHLKAPLAAWTEPHRDGVQIRVVLQRALSGGEDETFLLHAERLDTGGPHAIRDRWPFAPGQIVRDSGEGDDAAWLDAAPVGTVVRDAEADTWTKSGGPVNGSWFLNGGRGGAGATFVASHGPLTVMSVPGCCDDENYDTCQCKHHELAGDPIAADCEECGVEAATCKHWTAPASPTTAETTGALAAALDAVDWPDTLAGHMTITLTDMHRCACHAPLAPSVDRYMAEQAHLTHLSAIIRAAFLGGDQ